MTRRLERMVGTKEKFYGCIAASWVGSSMGAAVEGWSRKRIEETYGLLNSLEPFRHHGHTFSAGSTEDGIERQKLMATAIIEKKGRILARDLIAVWQRDLARDRMVYKQEPFDRSLLDLAKSGVPAAKLGSLWPYPNVIAMGRASHPLGLINAGDPQGAADDTFEVGRLYSDEPSPALRWAALYNACLAEACKPQATVASVLDAAREYAVYRAEPGELYRSYDTVEKELLRALDLAERHRDPVAMREEFYRYYDGPGFFNYAMSQANEIIPKGLAVFALTGGDPKEAILTAVNFGRDTDCLAAVAGGLSGALSGRSTIPHEWLARVNEATAEDPYTNNRRTIEETASSLFDAFKEKQARLRAYVELMEE
jgi:ADP-ribosylglycohydrolase